MARKYLSSKQYCVIGGERHKITGGVCCIDGKIFNIKNGIARYGSSNKSIVFPNSNDDWRAMFEDAAIVGSAGRNSSSLGTVSLTLPASTFNTPVYAFAHNAFYWTVYKLSNRSSSSITKTEVTHWPQFKAGDWPGVLVSTSGTNATLTWTGSRANTTATTTRGGGFFLLKFPDYSEAQIDAILAAMQSRVYNDSYSAYGQESDDGSALVSTRIRQTVFGTKSLYISQIEKSVSIAYFRSYSDYDVLVSNNTTVPILLTAPSYDSTYGYPTYTSSTGVTSLYGYGFILINYTHA